MKLQYPLVKIIEQDNLFYLYDARANVLLELSNKNNKIISSYINNKSLDCSSSLINDLQNNGILLPNEIKDKNIDMNDVDSLCDYISEYAIPQKLVIEVTDKCNLRCKYCLYTINGLNENSRKHGSKSITLSDAKLSINHYYDRFIHVSSKVSSIKFEDFLLHNPPMIGFYGGEALMEFHVIKECIRFCDNLNWGATIKDKIRYSITTNLTLLDNEMLEFCILNNIHLYVSIDGPLEENNKNRVFKNQKGTFECVYNNLLKIKERSIDYYHKNVIFQAVQAPNLRANIVEKFFLGMTEDKYYAGVGGFMYIPYRELGSTIPRYVLEEGFKSPGNLQFDDCERSIDIEMYILKAPLFKSRLNSIFNLIVDLDEVPNKNKINILPSCYIGFSKLFVSTQGQYHMCERTDFTKPIGDVRKGLNSKVIKDIYTNVIKMSKSKRCVSCWAFRFCSFCPATSLVNGNFSLAKEEECKYMQDMVLQTFKDLIYIKKNCNKLYNYITETFSPKGDMSIEKYL